VRLEHGEFELLRLAVADTARTDPRLIFPTPMPVSRVWSARSEPPLRIAADVPTFVSVRVWDCDRGSLASEAMLRISFRAHDLAPTVAFVEPPQSLAPAGGASEPELPASKADGAFRSTQPSDLVLSEEAQAIRPAPADLPPRRLGGNDISYLADVLRCSVCASSYSVARDELVCVGCGVRFPILDAIPILLKDSSIGTTLERIDYDSVHGVTDELISQTGTRWRTLIEGLGLAGTNVIEIGAGTGALTLGLLQQHVAARLTATDVSPKFLRLLGSRAARYRTPLSLIACDANVRHFRPEAFDLVVGRSILHHLLDYEVTLASCREMLRSGGAAVFFEPVLEGKTIVTMLMALILASERATDHGALSTADQRALYLQIRHQLRSKLDPLDRDALAQIEDKHIFKIAELRKLGRDLGFRDVEFVNSEELTPTYWPYLVQTCTEIGIPAEKLASYQWIGVQFANTFGLIFRDQLTTPMGFFIFQT